MAKKIKIVLGQVNLISGDIQGNLTKLIQSAKKARDTLKANVILFPELAITGYLHEDLVFRQDFLRQAHLALEQFTQEVTGVYCVIGHTFQTPQGLFNACSLIYNQHILNTTTKKSLPNYGVFDEQRYYISGKGPTLCLIDNIPVGLAICEDLWSAEPIKKIAKEGARLILSPNASPFELNKHEKRIEILKERISSHAIPIFYTNLIAGQDDLIFDGGSMVLNQHGELVQHAGFFKENLPPVEIEISEEKIHIATSAITIPNKTERAYQALVLGVKDYVEKNHFPGVIVGLSGGIDSALTLAIAVDALGNDRVSAILMPSRYTSSMSNEDAIELANNLHVKYQTFSIEEAFSSFIKILSLKNQGIPAENLQSRCRGTLLMALSNQTGQLVLSTGNRSEFACGYTTLYGDMVGGLAVLKDVPKTFVYELSDYRNQLKKVIPQRIIDRPPSAELAPNQKDEDTLPSYPILDKILEYYLNQELGASEIIAKGFEAETVTKIITLIHRSEYKRRQAPIGIRIHHQAFGRDRRYPITSGFKG